MKRQHRAGYTIDLYKKPQRLSQADSVLISHSKIKRKTDDIAKPHQVVQDKAFEKTWKQNQASTNKSNSNSYPLESFESKSHNDQSRMIHPPQLLLQAATYFAVDSPRHDVPTDREPRGFLKDHPVPLIMLAISFVALIATLSIAASGFFIAGLSWPSWVAVGFMLGALTFILAPTTRFKHSEPRGSAAYHFYDFINTFFLSLIWVFLFGLLFGLIFLLFVLVLLWIFG